MENDCQEAKQIKKEMNILSGAVNRLNAALSELVQMLGPVMGPPTEIPKPVEEHVIRVPLAERIYEIRRQAENITDQINSVRGSIEL